MANPRTMARIAARIQERAAYCLHFELKDPRATFVTVTRVELTNDLSLAKVYYSVMGDDADRSKAAHMLEHARGFVQRQVARVLHMRRMPTLRFEYDDSIETAAHIDQVIREARERDRRIDPTLAEREEVEARQMAEEAAAKEAARIAARDAKRAAEQAEDAAEDAAEAQAEAQPGSSATEDSRNDDPDAQAPRAAREP